MNKRTQATSISTKVRQTVMLRDNGHCIFCGSHHMLSVAHFKSRATGGLGIEQNLAIVCMPCHVRLDQSIYRKVMLDMFCGYLKAKYKDLDEINLIYRKGE